MSRPFQACDAEQLRTFLEGAATLPAKILEEVGRLIREELKHRSLSTCGYCGSTQPLIEGDEVHPGYDGYPCCPDCKGV